jgi:hypothetical protein
MEEQEYIKTRLEDQIAWYDTKSQYNKRGFTVLRIAELLVAASVPFVVGLITPDLMEMKFLAQLLSLLVVVITGLLSLYRFQELWTDYRTTAESLRHEKFLYETKVKPYDIDRPFPLLVQRVETHISREHSVWLEDPEQKGAGKGSA